MGSIIVQNVVAEIRKAKLGLQTRYPIASALEHIHDVKTYNLERAINDDLVEPVTEDIERNKGVRSVSMVHDKDQNFIMTITKANSLEHN